MAQYILRSTSKLLQAGAIKRNPAHYQALLNNPPPPSVTRSQRWSTTTEGGDIRLRSPASKPRDNKSQKVRLRPLAVSWQREDSVRRRFLADHPWERNRAMSMMEPGRVAGDLGQGTDSWTLLAQLTARPTVDDLVTYSVHLNTRHSIPLSSAYALAVTQYRLLRRMQQHSTRTARLEVQALGASFSAVGSAQNTSHIEEPHLNRWNTGQRQQKATSKINERQQLMLAPTDFLSQPFVGVSRSGKVQLATPSAQQVQRNNRHADRYGWLDRIQQEKPPADISIPLPMIVDDLCIDNKTRSST